MEIIVGRSKASLLKRIKANDCLLNNERTGKPKISVVRKSIIRAVQQNPQISSLMLATVRNDIE